VGFCLWACGVCWGVLGGWGRGGGSLGFGGFHCVDVGGGSIFVVWDVGVKFLMGLGPVWGLLRGGLGGGVVGGGGLGALGGETQWWGGLVRVGMGWGGGSVSSRDYQPPRHKIAPLVRSG